MEYAGHEYKLNIQAILDEEAKNPDYSFFDELEDFGKHLRFSEIMRMCEYVSSSYEEMFTARKLAFSDLPKIVQGCLEEAGFHSAEPVQA